MARDVYDEEDRRPIRKRSRSKQPEQVVEEVVERNYDTSLLNVLYHLLPNFPSMSGLAISGTFRCPAELLTTAGINTMTQELQKDSNLYLDCLSYLDTITLLETTHYNNAPGTILDDFYNSVVANRSTGIRNDLLDRKNRETIAKFGDGLYRKLSEEARQNEEDRIDQDIGILEHLSKNRIVLGFYIYLVVYNLYKTVLPETSK